MPLDRLIELVLERSGLRDALVREGTFEAQGRVENLDEMVRVAAEYEAGGEEVTLAGFLEGVALQADADLVDESAGAVTLMTIHNAKGLEFDTVLITGTVTNVCCESTARDAMMRNFKTVMITDGNAANTDEDHNAALNNFYLTFGDIMSTDFAIGCLTRNAQKGLAAAE